MIEKKNILWLDDDEVLNLIADQIFSSIADQIDGYRFLTNGDEALLYLKHCDENKKFPDILLIDLKMPEMDGLEFLRHYYTMFLNNYPNVQIYVLTSSVRAADMEKVRAFSFVKDYVIKPITLKKLKELLSL